MILAHHAGEDLVLMLAASGAGGVSVLAAIAMSRLTQFVDRVRKLMNVLWQRA